MTDPLDHLSSKEKQAAVNMALAGGMDPAEVFRAVTRNVYGATNRRKLIVQWGKRMKLEASEALRIAQNAGLIPTTHAPRQK